MLTAEDLKVLISLCDLGVRNGGLNAAKPLLELAAKLQALQQTPPPGPPQEINTPAHPAE